MPPAIMVGRVHDAAVILKREGWRDQDIADALRVSLNVVVRWRRINGVAPLIAYQARIDDETALELYNDGRNDAEIGKHFGSSLEAARKWRVMRGLPSQRQTREKHLRKSVRQFTRTGWPAERMAEELDCSLEVVLRVCRDLGIKPKREKPGQARTTATTAPSDLLARIKRAVGRYLAPDIADDAISDIYLAVLEGKLAAGEIEERARTYTNRVVGAFASKWGAKSLDEEIGEDGFTRGDMLVDDRALDAFDNIDWSDEQ